jgi:hypothetical protein
MNELRRGGSSEGDDRVKQTLLRNFGSRGIVLIVLCSILGAWTVSVEAGGHAKRPKLSVAPSCLSLNASTGRMKVTLTGVTPRMTVLFVASPLKRKGGFGGGIMKTQRAGKRGIVFFRYPPPRSKSEVGTWRVSASARSGAGRSKIIATTRFVVKTGHC